MNQNQIDAVQQAIEALKRFPEDPNPFTYRIAYAQAQQPITNLRKLLEQPAPVQEPLVWKLKPEELGCGLKAHITAREYNQHPFDIQRCYEFIGSTTTPPAQPAVPEGWKPVPVELTDEMRKATDHAESVDEAWKAILAAAPEKGSPRA